MLNMKQFGLHTIESKLQFVIFPSLISKKKKKTQMIWDLFGKFDTNAYFLRLKGGK